MATPIKSSLAKFREIYGPKGEAEAFFSPGRVNLIGEHLDYNGGRVLPMAIDLGTTVVTRKRADNKVNLCSAAFDTRKSISLDKIEPHADDNWTKYVKGAIQEMQKAKMRLAGMDVFVDTDLPISAGLSSSASLEVGCIFAFLSTAGARKIDRKTIALIGKAAENNFVGVRSGIMDQFICANAQKDHALFLNTETLEFEPIPLHFLTHSLVVVNANKKRSLVESEYNARRKDCETALEKLREKKKTLKHLCALTTKDLDLLRNVLKGKELKRAEFVVEENERVGLAVKALKKNDLKTFGALMVESHKGLRDKYEVSGKELNALVDISMSMPGVLGARMTGAGFGGSIIALVPKDRIEEYIETVYVQYKAQTRHDADVYVVKPSDGAYKIGTYK